MDEFEKEWQKMLDGEVYRADMQPFIDRLVATRDKLWQLNNLRPSLIEEQRAIIRDILGGCGERFHFNQPFRCDYGCNITIGEDFFANFNLTILDEARVTFGHHVFIGPNVSIYTACHSLDAAERDKAVEWAEPVTVGDSVWIGGSTTILPGVTIGSRVVIGAGSVVTRDIPDDVVVAGNPARIIRRLA